jgi:hypothetical protein
MDAPELFAGFLCATHVGKTLRIDGVEGICHAITLTRDRPTVRVILHERGDSRDDGSVRKRHHCLTLDPRTVVTVVDD